MRLTALLPIVVLPVVLGAGVISVDTLKHKCTRKSQTGDTIDVHYRGTLASDGTEFDASYKRGQPLTFAVGTGRVIKGWDEGLLEMCPGDKRTLTIPPELGYGDRDMGPIPSGSTLSAYSDAVRPRSYANARVPQSLRQSSSAFRASPKRTRSWMKRKIRRRSPSLSLSRLLWQMRRALQPQRRRRRKSYKVVMIL